MILFIALPIGSIVMQSMFVERERVVKIVENCGPFGCTQTTQIDLESSAGGAGRGTFGQFAGLSNYFNRNHLAAAEISEAVSNAQVWSDFVRALFNLPFYKALAFTLTYTVCVTPLVLTLGFMAALAVNRLPRVFKGPAIFASILPMIVTPLIGSLILFWMIDSRGVLGATLQYVFDDPNLSLKASPLLTWIMLIVYGAWHHSPFAFVVLYAALQTVPQDSLESAVIDGANKWERVRYVVIPYLMPVFVFIALISLMDNFRVFEPIIGFSAEANAQSLSWLIYNDLRNESIQLYGSAAATSILTIIGVAIILTPTLIRTWRDFKLRA